MSTYGQLNAAWPDDLKAPTPREALAGTKRLIKLCYRHAKEEGVFSGKPMKRRFKIVSGNRHTWLNDGVWCVNPNYTWPGFGGWKGIVHGVSHWAQRRFWPNEKPHGPRHVWIERMLADYAIKHFLDGSHVRPLKDRPPVNVIDVRAARVAKRIKQWEAKRRRAENALKKLRKQDRYYQARKCA